MKRERLRTGDRVRLSESMSVDGHRDAVISRIDGGDIYVELEFEGKTITAHRYENEMEKVTEGE